MIIQSEFNGKIIFITVIGDFPTETVIIVSIVSLGTAGSVIGIILIRRKRIRRLN